MKRSITFLFLLVLLLSQAGWTRPLQPARPLRVCVYENAPKIYTAKDGTISGFWPELFLTIAGKEGWQTEWVSGNWNECLAKLAAGDIDILPDTGWTLPRSQEYAFSQETVLLSWTRLYAARGTHIESILDLDGKTIAGLAGSFNMDGPGGIKDLASQFGLHSTFVGMESYTQVFAALENGEVDAGITNKDFGNLNERKYDVVRTPIIFQPARMLFAFPKEGALTPYLIERIDAEMKALKADKGSVYYQALDKYLGAEEAGAEAGALPVGVKNLLLALAAISVFLLAVWFVSLVEVRRRTRDLRRSEARFRVLFDFIPDAVFVHPWQEDGFGKFLQVNRVARQRYGYSNEEFLHLSPDDVSKPSHAQNRLGQQVRKVLASERYHVFESVQMTKDGREFPVEISSTVFDYGGTETILSVVRDISERKRREAENRKFKKIIETATQSVIITDIEGMVLYINDSYLAFSGFQKEEVIGQSMYQFTDEQGATLLREQIVPALLSRGNWQGEMTVVKANKAVVPAYLNCSLLSDDQSQPEYLVAVFSDISQRKQAEAALRESEERFRLTFHTSPDSININRLEDGMYVDINLGFTEITGYTREDVIGRTSLEINIWHNPEDRQRLVEGLKKHGRVDNLEAEFRMKDGTVVTGLMSSAVIQLKGVSHIISITRNIEDIKQAQEALRRSEHLLSEAQRIAHIGSWELDLVENHLYWSDEIYRLFELPKHAFGATFEALLDVIHPEDRDMVSRVYTESVENHATYNIEHRLLMAHGRIKWVQEQCETFYDEEGKALRSVGTMMDITAKKLADMALRASEERYRHLFENSPVALFEVDISELIGYLQNLTNSDFDMTAISDYMNAQPEVLRECLHRLRLLDINQAGIALSEARDKQESLGRVDSFLSPANFAAIQTSLPDLLISEDRIEGEMSMETLRGTKRDIYFRLVWDKEDDSFQQSAMVAIVDITELKRARLALENRVHELQQIHLLSLRLGHMQDSQRVAEHTLEAMRSALQPDVALFYLREGEQLNLLSHRAENTSFAVSEAQLHQVGRCLCGLAAETAKPVFSRDVFNDRRCTLPECKKAGIRSFAGLPLLAGEQVIGVIGLGSLSERDFEPQRSFLETLVNEAAVSLQNALLLADLRRHEAELEQRVDERTADLVQANQELESFSYSVSHDLRAPLRAIDGFSLILAEDYVEKLDDEAKRLIGVVRSNTQRMGQLIDDLLAFSRVGRKAIVLSRLDMSRLVTSVFCELIDEAQREKIQFTVQALPPAWADASLLRQVFSNLLANAVKFSSTRETPQIEVGFLVEKGETVYYVKDNGVGFEMNYVHKLYQIFQRLHSQDEFEGTGVGLSIVHRIITRHGGRVWAEAEPGQGATFYFTLPSVDP